MSAYDRELAAKLKELEAIEARVARQEKATHIGLLLLLILAGVVLGGLVIAIARL